MLNSCNAKKGMADRDKKKQLYNDSAKFQIIVFHTSSYRWEQIVHPEEKNKIIVTLLNRKFNYWRRKWAVMIKRLKYKRYLMNCGYKVAQKPNGLFARYNFKFHSSFFM